MSISNLLVPNNYNILQNSLNYKVSPNPISFSLTGPFNMSCSFTYVVVGILCNLTLIGEVSIASVSTIFTSPIPLPSPVIPLINVTFPIIGTNSNVETPLNISITNNGIVTVAVTGSSFNFTSGQNCGFTSITLTYQVASS